ncbi:dethiobiotin synthase [Paenibacillus mucilaginosus]|uniref:ATP-dependent dethiobiotin synthetase BioD n=1 Tax=Paenibacillus mucilaginosus (strain KNP414) TaxID=1036673 RepID=F8FQB7_PAEMK|nr:dethiobiotin synthase [Paenibacillus mucilaginosus]AEI39178.1 dithiobiotin synthetase [Paenibacillus mucilaginosus KNP414]MCG7217978.1 dethiobiotin synthase [Paenibacillus mucilaginosus]WDM28193.1 dethiobiotin synthase [Paenibacillus mucilaginosus]
MGKGLFVTGTDTEVGKTWVTSLLAAAAARRISLHNAGQGTVLSNPLHLWKPIQSGSQPGDPRADSFRLLRGSGIEQTEEETVTYSLKAPLAPWMAARRAGTLIPWEELLAEGERKLASYPRLLVEGAGGLLVPLTERYTVADLAAAMGLPLLIVARTRLGTVNHTLLTIEAARQRGLRIAGVLLNGYPGDDDLALSETIEMIEQLGSVPVLGVFPQLEEEPVSMEEWEAWRDQWIEIVESRIRMDEIMSFF